MTFLIIGLIVGIILTGFLIFKLSPGLMLKESKSNYGFDETMERILQAVEEGGWKVPGNHDLQATLLKHGKQDVNNVNVIEICNPDLAEKILKTEDEKIVSSLMPCRIAVYEKADGSVYVSRMNSGLLSKAMGKVTRKQMAVAFRETEGFLLSVTE